MKTNETNYPTANSGLITSKLHEKLSSGDISFGLIDKTSANRKAVESYISDQFYKEHHAKLLHFMPQLLSMECGSIASGAVGIRSAKNEKLFLEQYFEKSAEQHISTVFQQPVLRDDIVEIGNLVATRRGSSYLLFVILASILHEAGYRWVICTATSQVEHIIRKMKFDSDVLCEANPEKLTDDVSNWGTYYSNHPRVIVGDVKKAIKEIRKSPLLKAMISPYQFEISRIAMELMESNHAK